ncbi:putative cytochrome c-type biogenesis protein; putative membrane protein [Bradyrhizobium sp. ORS 285]|uniref:cytochrome c biogenesis CcdA family protein n=1 Tax=Bradyrhizobium sp. ORS 285 TaxID=115808 RepID=UPI00024056B7|nr:cytochrome c biogenesis CcdA family protein [Bradyrhizobium sp. ORS 285]CCD87701.1 putative cytochrome c-type biogenesis protein; membrane protein [Bradyrhizobium sp. ORS 285]SMX61450.1 putative cytochrome c-type biogenesis protein; putative membrane protein [Bradyrhizobium sp. ORS 285]
MLALAFVAGLLSILSPCVLPLVPIVLGAAVSAHPRGALALAAGLALSFTAIGLFIALAGNSVGLDAGVFRLVAAVLMLAIGVVLLVPSWQAQLAVAGGPVQRWADRNSQDFAASGAGGQFMIGLLLGAVWSPCVGPTLGAASLLASQGHDLVRVTLTMLAFGFGAGLPLVVLGMVSRTTMMRLRERLLSAGKLGKTLMGAAFVIVAVAILSGADKQLEAWLVAISPAWLTELTTSI